MSNQENQLLNLQILWVTMLGSIFIYVVISTLIAGPVVLDIVFDFSDPYLLIFALLSVVATLMSSILPRMHMKSKETIDINHTISDDELYKSYRTPFILKIALIEAVAILGLVLSVLKNQNLMLPFASVSAVAILYHFPTKERIRNYFL